jgi:hypothetical protein
MKSLRYLNFILTIIAFALIVIIFQNMNVMPKAYADRPSFIRPDGTVDVHIKSIEGRLDVNIDRVGGSSIYDGIPVKQK